MVQIITALYTLLFEKSDNKNAAIILAVLFLYTFLLKKLLVDTGIVRFEDKKNEEKISKIDKKIEEIEKKINENEKKKSNNR